MRQMRQQQVDPLTPIRLSDSSCASALNAARHSSDCKAAATVPKSNMRWRSWRSEVVEQNRAKSPDNSAGIAGTTTAVARNDRSRGVSAAAVVGRGCT